MEKLKNTLNDLSLTNEEVSRLSEAFKKEEFRKLFREYAEELQDPENRKKYEEELTAMENERGMDVEFINPTPGHVLKTIQNSEKKVFINICQSDKIEKPSVNKTTKEDIRGATWSIPHSFSPPREDIDKKKENCIVYDVVYNANAYQIGTKNPRFRKMLHDTALEGIEKMFNVSLDKINYKILKLKMKGVPVATVIRKKRVDFEEKQAEIESREDDPLKFPYPDIKETEKTVYTVNEVKESTNKSNEFTKPFYKIKYSNDFEIMNYVGEEVKHSIRPKKMIIEIKLPLISSANSVDLDIDSRNLKMTTVKPIKYLLELKLTYPVLSDLGSAKFDKSTKTLKLDLPVEQIPEEIQSINDNLPNIPNSLIEEHPLDISENKDGIQEYKENESEILDESPPSNTDHDFGIKEYREFDEIERIIPDIELKFRNNSAYAFMICNIRNIEKISWKVQWESISKTKQQVIIAFSNCGQGGWKNLYKIPLIIDFKSEVDVIDNYIQCFISEENMVIQLPLQINSQFVESVSFRNQTFFCKWEEPVYFWNTLCNPDIPIKNNDNNETFQTAYGMINKETLKIICVPRESLIDLQSEFPKIQENIPEMQNNKSIQAEQENKVAEEINKKITEEFTEKITEEINKEINEEIMTETDELLEKESPEKIKETKPSVLSSDYFETRRSLEHRTNCPVELNSDLLFDLE